MTTETIEESVALAIQGGASVIQLREKNSTSREFYELAVRVKKITEEYDVPLIINDRVDIALAVKAAGVHLGQSDLPIEKAREILGEDAIIGATANKLSLAVNAWQEGADYLGVGDVFGSSTKHNTTAITLCKLREICESVDIPVVAIGGIKKENVHLLRDTKIAGVAVISAVIGQTDIVQAGKNLISNFQEA